MFVVGYTEGGAPYGHVEWAAIGAEDSSDSGRGPIASEQTLEPFCAAHRGEPGTLNYP
jgi:hypothetical protein